MTISYETSEQMLNFLTFSLTCALGLDFEDIENMVAKLFEEYCNTFGITKIEDPTSLDGAFDEEPADECDYEIGYNPYAGCFTDDV